MGIVLYITLGVIVVSGLIFYENKTNDLTKIISIHDGRQYLVKKFTR